MPLEVIGSGFGRTGTNSLKLALEQLGFGPCHHMFEVANDAEQLPYWQAAARGEPLDWDEVFTNYHSSVDWPSAKFWRELAEHFPQAKVVHSVRPPEKWFESVHNTIYPSMQSWRSRPEGARLDRGRMAYELIAEQTFYGRLEDREYALEVFNAHTAEVTRTIAPDRLLVFDVAEGWGPLCRHLDVPAPDTPFPRVNSTAEFTARVVSN